MLKSPRVSITAVAPHAEEPRMFAAADVRAMLITPWRTNCRVTALLIEHLPAPLWNMPVPGAPRRTVRMVAAHFHNSRTRWIRTLGEEHGIRTPVLVNPRKVARRELLKALERSGAGIESLLELGVSSGGHVPLTKAYVWRNLPLDVGHVLTYFVAHEGHHRGQLVMLARGCGHRVPQEVSDGLWQWSRISRKTAPLAQMNTGRQGRA